MNKSEEHMMRRTTRDEKIVNPGVYEVLVEPNCDDTTKCYVDDLVYRLRKRAEIRRQIPGRKSVQDNAPDRIADLLEEAANEIERNKKEGFINEDLRNYIRNLV